MYKYCYIEPIIFTSYLIWYTGRIWNGYVASRFNRIGEIAEVLNSSMTEFFKKNDSEESRLSPRGYDIRYAPEQAILQWCSEQTDVTDSASCVRTSQLAASCQPRHWDVSTACSGTVRTARRGLEEERMTDTCRLCRLGLPTRIPPCLGKHVEWDCGTARQCRLSRFIAR